MTLKHELDEIGEPDTHAEPLTQKVIGQLEDILGREESAGAIEEQDQGYLYYSVPMAGVRYYGYDGSRSRDDREE